MGKALVIKVLKGDIHRNLKKVRCCDQADMTAGLMVHTLAMVYSV